MKIYSVSVALCLFASMTGCSTQPLKSTELPALAAHSRVSRSLAATLDNPGSLTAGFRLLEVRPIKEADGVARIFEHEKSGARLIYLSNSDDNKLFAIGFRTVPQNNTGVAHILEHSVLNGSKKFPLKEPFVELLKGSVNTFVNALTYSDKTIYPVASRNDKDFRNLMDVYMDAVTHPLIYQTPYTLLQEGWRLELDPKTQELTYNGVVFNEMKGALSSPDRLLASLVQRNLFPTVTYGFESGGDPAFIPQLTQQGFLGFHKKYYHPSNSYLFLYGNGNVEEHLRFLDEQYLSEFSRKRVKTAIPIEPPFTKPVEKNEYYSINPNDSTQGKTYMGLSSVIGRSTDPELFLAMDILEYLLLETDSSPLKRAILDAKLGKNVEGYWDPTIQQPVFAIILKNTDPEKKVAFRKTVDQTLRQLVTKGIPPQLVESAINRKEFLLREFETQGSPKGLAYYDKIMDSWLYGGDPLVHVQFEATLEKIKKQASSGYFENLIRQHLLKNPHRALTVLTPKPGLDQQKAEQLRTALKKYKDSLKPEELTAIKDQAAELKRRQQAPDLPENLEKIPLLKISDINPKAEILPLQEFRNGEYRMFHHNVFTNQIGYLNLYFDTRGTRETDIPTLSLLSKLLGKMNTERFSFQDLSNELNTHTGGVSPAVSVFSDKASLNTYAPKFVVQSKALLTKLPKLIFLLNEILLHTRFDDGQRLMQIVQEEKSRMEDAIGSSGHRFAMSRLASYASQSGKYAELASGISYYQFLVQTEKNLQKDPSAVIKNLQKIASEAFSRTNLMISFTSPETDFQTARLQLEALALLFPSLPIARAPALETRAENEGLMIPSEVQFVAKGGDFRKLGFDFSGSLLVANNVISNDYLWNRVRVQNGAYGSWMKVSPQGMLTFLSYRDPGLKETLEAYDKAPSYLSQLNLSPREVTKYILGAVSDLDMPLSPGMKGPQAMTYYFSNITSADLQKIRDEVLSSQLEDLKSFSSLLEKTLQQNAFVVVGNAKKIQENKGLFGKIVPVME